MIPRIWVLADERPGTASQAIGVADALGMDYETKTIRHSALAWLPNAAVFASLAGITAESRAQLSPPWPDLVIAAGRRAGIVARWIKRNSGGRATLVQVMFPGRWASASFDLIATPRHDGISGANVMAITGAPHGVTARTLDAAADAWRERFAAFTRPVVALLLGGATRRRGFDEPSARTLGRITAEMVTACGGSLAVTSSRRTGPAIDHVLAGAAAAGLQPALCHRWSENGENPYLAMIALADVLVVSGDSVSMLSEACATTKPVYLFAPSGFATAKHARLHRELIVGGFVRALPSQPGARIESWTHPPLNAAGEVAHEIRRRFPTIFAAEASSSNRLNSNA